MGQCSRGEMLRLPVQSPSLLRPFVSHRALSTYDWRRDHAIFHARCSEASDESVVLDSHSGSGLTAVAAASLDVEPMSLLTLRVDGEMQVEIATENEKCIRASLEIVAPGLMESDVELHANPDGRGGVAVAASHAEQSTGSALRAL